MFTGIVDRMGTITEIEDSGGKRRFVLETGDLSRDMQVGDSIAVNGVCLTAIQVDAGGLAVEAVMETLDRTNLSEVGVGDAVNLERPMPAAGRFDGHIVQGHVDGVATVRSIVTEGASIRMWFDVPEKLRRYLVEKGSVAVDGVSLTVSGVDNTGFEVVLIPHTLDVTVFGSRAPGDAVNLEMDVLAKYVERLLEES